MISVVFWNPEKIAMEYQGGLPSLSYEALRELEKDTNCSYSTEMEVQSKDQLNEFINAVQNESDVALSYHLVTTKRRDDFYMQASGLFLTERFTFSKLAENDLEAYVCESLEALSDTAIRNLIDDTVSALYDNYIANIGNVTYSCYRAQDHTYEEARDSGGTSNIVLPDSVTPDIFKRIVKFVSDDVLGMPNTVGTEVRE